MQQHSVKTAFGPVRFEMTRPYAKDCLKLMEPVLPKMDVQKVCRLVAQHLLPRDFHEFEKKSQAEIENLRTYANYRFYGSNIFQLDPVLSKNLLLTSIEEVPCGALKAPLPSFYLHWGVIDDIRSVVSEDWFEGAFVDFTEGYLNIQLVLTQFGSPGFAKPGMLERMVSVEADLSNPDRLICDAVDESFAQATQNYQKEYGELNKKFLATLSPMAAAQEIQEAFERNTKILQMKQTVARLVVNAMLFLVAEPDDNFVEWQEGVPPERLARFRNCAKPTKFMKFEMKLQQEGFRKVRFVGRRFGALASSAMIAGMSGAQKQTHVRRGHYRHQAFGPSHSLRKWKFIAPTVINGNWGDANNGHIYDVAA